jgi:hypothetical protein
MSSLRIDKADFHIQKEPDYALGLAHGTGFMSEFKDHNNREPNLEEMLEMSKVLSDRTEELREVILRSE